MWRRLGWKAPLAGAVLALVVAFAAANLGYYGGSTVSGRYCTRCHQIQAPHDRWAQSVHRAMDCRECHGSAFSADLDLHATNVRHLYYQMIGRIPGRVRLTDAQVDRVAASCARCHRNTFARWKAAGHSVAYSHIFLSPEHNRKTRLMDDCLRCHGMFADGSVADIVTPVDNTGPWRLVNASFAARATIPCLACHAMHSDGTPAGSPNYLEPRQISYARTVKTTSLGFYDRRERRHVMADDLPLPAMRAKGRPVTMSPDRRQTVCYQCHAPEAVHEVGSGDDRTAVGVHEGIGCLGCHDAHTLDARASCANCHPAQSNCRLDVATMDTSFKSASSRHNVHFVACADCHVKGVPRGRVDPRAVVSAPTASATGTSPPAARCSTP
jgi:hypothetical protein